MPHTFSKGPVQLIKVLAEAFFAISGFNASLGKKLQLRLVDLTWAYYSSSFSAPLITRKLTPQFVV
jgi:hypothetical protein